MIWLATSELNGTLFPNPLVDLIAGSFFVSCVFLCKVFFTNFKLYLYVTKNCVFGRWQVMKNLFIVLMNSVDKQLRLLSDAINIWNSEDFLLLFYFSFLTYNSVLHLNSQIFVFFLSCFCAFALFQMLSESYYRCQSWIVFKKKRRK